MSVDPSLLAAADAEATNLESTDKVLQALVSGSGYVFKLNLVDLLSEKEVESELFFQLRAQQSDDDPNLVDLATMTRQLNILEAAHLSTTTRKDDNAFFNECAKNLMAASPDQDTRDRAATLVVEFEKAKIPLGVLWASFLEKTSKETWAAKYEGLKETHSIITGLIEQYRLQSEKKKQE